MTLTTYSVEDILRAVGWTVEITEDFERWWDRLTEDERISIDGMIRVLEAQGPSLGQPYTVDTAGSLVAQLRVPHGDRTLCVLYVPEHSRTAVVLLLGTTTGTYDEICPPDEIEAANRIYQKYLTARNRH
jgi:hypothetical protein